ncbi:MAG: outer membrane lipoprotein-sorting protein [Alphaproteobacteria bacterium]|nr:outer membrane lipoprotein-sorting protein [Alphaproteobacteria bacterium]
MNRLFVRLLPVLLALAFSGAALATPSAQDIVAAADKVRNPGQPFRLTNTLTEYVGGSPRDRVTLVVYAKENPQTHQFSNVVRYVDPPRDTGKMVLMNGSNMWFYDPSSKVSVRISPQQRLMGQASDGDVVTANFARDYTAKLIGEETLEDADRKNRACWHLNLTAASDEAVYSRVEYWVEKDTNRPVKGKFFSDSGRLLKIAYYHKYVEQLGGMRPSETIIIDAVDQNLVTTMSNSDMRAQDIPDAWFQREYLPHLTVE